MFGGLGGLEEGGRVVVGWLEGVRSGELSEGLEFKGIRVRFGLAGKKRKG